MTDVVLILTTVPEDFVTSGFTRTLVDAGHAACVSVFPPMESTFRWEGVVETTRERQVVIKTTSDRVAAVEAAITAAHPYDVPELLVLPVSGGGAAYLAWVAGR
ncbi:MAG: divalent-cation tolerance protein CutA [Acidobacteria bacterium]|nr:divalent-cation tolerance protein CutA [Acidobacteriota bacterium]